MEGRGAGSSELTVAVVLVYLSPPWCLWVRCGLEAGGPGPWPQEHFLPSIGGGQAWGRRPPTCFHPHPRFCWQRLREPWLSARSGLCAFGEQRQNKINWFPGRSSGRARRRGAKRSGSLPVSPSQGLWLSAATSCRLLFYIWYFEKSMMIVNGVQAGGGASHLGEGRSCPGATAGAAGASSEMSIPYGG